MCNARCRFLETPSWIKRTENNIAIFFPPDDDSGLLQSRNTIYRRLISLSNFAKSHIKDLRFITGKMQYRKAFLRSRRASLEDKIDLFSIREFLLEIDENFCKSLQIITLVDLYFSCAGSW